MDDTKDFDNVPLVRANYVPEVLRPSPPIETIPQNLHLLDYWRVLMARRWTVIAILLTALAVTFIWTYTQVPLYRASMSLQIDPENPNILNFKDPYQIEDSSEELLRT